MAEKSTCAVLIHGLHLGANGWESLVWGNPKKGEWGSIPRGVEIAWRTNAETMVWGSGASERQGKKEADVMYERAVAGISELADICGTTSDILTKFLSERSVKDTEAKDTAAEIKNCFDLCLQRSIESVILVPYASQAPIAVRRVLGLALENDAYASFRHRVSIQPSDTRYPGVSMQDVVIFTPPHRGDRVANPSHLLARKTLDVIQRLSKSGDADGVAKFLAEWKMFLERF